jgi:hypothetical protein
MILVELLNLTFERAWQAGSKCQIRSTSVLSPKLPQPLLHSRPAIRKQKDTGSIKGLVWFLCRKCL